MSYEEINVADGKYTVQIGQGDHAGQLKALRHGEPWQDLAGYHLVYWLAVELRDARAAAQRHAQPQGGEHLQRDLQMAAALMDEASAILESVGSETLEKIPNWRWPLADELGGAASILRDQLANAKAAAEARDMVSPPQPSTGKAAPAVRSGHDVIEEALRTAVKHDPNNSPFGMSHAQGVAYQMGMATAYQHALEMIPAGPSESTSSQRAHVEAPGTSHGDDTQGLRPEASRG